MANGFGSGLPVYGPAALSSREPSPSGNRASRRHSAEFYFDDGNVVFLVERTLYKIHKSVLSRHSPFFRNLFGLPAPDDKQPDGSSDEVPLHLPHILQDQFDAFLSTVYPSWRPVTHSTEALINILCLATKWEFATTRSYAIELLTSRSLSPVLRIELARAYDVPGWLLPSLVELARLRTPLSDVDAERLGLPTVLRLGRAREAILRHRYSRALEMPKEDFFELPVTRHATCWKGMAKALGVALRNGERGGTDEDLVEEVLTAFRRLDDESLCEHCNQANLFRSRCARWLDLDSDSALIANLFSL